MKTDEGGQIWQKFFLKRKGFYHPKRKIGKEFWQKSKKSEWIQKTIYYTKLKESERILDAGCGNGITSITLATLGYNVTALDYSEEMLKNVQILIRAAIKDYPKIQIQTRQGNLQHLSFENNTFDLTLCQGVIEHWTSKEKRLNAIKELVRVTKKGGYILITVPNGKYQLLWSLLVHPDSPPIIKYDIASLRKEMKVSGCKTFKTDGLGISSFFEEWLRFSFTKYPILIGNRFLSLFPTPIRTIICPHILCIGRKAL